MATIGEQLKAAREAKGVSESDAGRETKILTKLIVAMEADNFSELPVPTYAKGFIRLYASWLGIDPAPLIDEYMQKHNTRRKPLINEESQLTRNTQTDSAVAGKARQVFTTLTGRFKAIPAAPVKDIRVLAAAVAALLVLIGLAVSISTCARNRAASQPAPAGRAAPARMLLDEPVPDLYLVEPGQIEMN